MYLNFNVLNNEVFESAADDMLLETAERASVRNKEIAAEGRRPYVGTAWVPDIFERMGMADRSAFLEWVKEMGIDILMSDKGWKVKKRKDGTWERREYEIDSSI